MTQFRDIPVGAFFSLYAAADSTLCEKVSKDASQSGYGTYRYAGNTRPHPPYMIAHDVTVIPRSDTVIIRRDAQTGDAIAFMPEGDANPGMVVSYMHIGQHSEASHDYYRSTKVAQYADADVRELVRELVSVGYAVHLVKRMPSWRVLAKARSQLDKY